MNHLAWIQEQFKKKNKTASYRNVLIHTSFVETVVKKEARHWANFECAIKILKSNPSYSKKTIDMIDELRKKRNRIIHELLKNEQLDENLINATIKEMKELLRNIYHNLLFVQQHFQKKYKVDTTRF